MKLDVKHLPKSRVRLMVALTAGDLEPYIDHAIEELGRHVAIPGFRPGKAPRPLVREQVGEERMLSHVLEEAIQESYKQAVTEQELLPVSEPAISVSQFGEANGLTYTAEVDQVPDVKLGDYQRIKVDPKQYAPKTVEKSDLETFLERLKRRHATITPVDRGAQVGDFVELSYQGKVEGVLKDNLTNAHHPAILGEKVFLPDFEAEIMGMKQGEKKVFTIDIPTGPKKEEQAEFTVTLLNLSEVVLPPDEALAKLVGKESFEEVTKMAEEFLSDQATNEAAQAYEGAVIEAVTKKAKLELPDSLVDREVHHRLHNLEHQIKQAGQTLTGWLKEQKKTVEEISKDLRPAAESAVRSGLVLRAIAEADGILDAGASATDEALKKTVERLVEYAKREK